MVVRLYSVFDRVGQVCGPVVAAGNDGVAMRQFRDVMKENPNRTDYQLLYVGRFDDSKGILLPEAMPVVVEADSVMESSAELVLGGNGHAR